MLKSFALDPAVFLLFAIGIVAVTALAFIF